MNSLLAALSFLLGIIFYFVLLLILLRLLLQILGARWHNPISQFIIRLTEPILKPLAKVLPSVNGFSLAALLLFLMVATLKIGLLIWLQEAIWPNAMGTLVLSITTFFQMLFNVYFWAIVLRVILSWINPLQTMVLQEIIYVLTEPVLRPAQRLIPPIAGFDLSPIAIIIMLQLLQILLIVPMQRLGVGLIFG